MALSKNKIKQIHSLELKKFRTSTQSFVAEGFKCVGELIKEGFKPKTIIATAEWKSPIKKTDYTEYIEVTDDELRKTSFLPHPQQVLGIFEIPDTNIQDDINNIASKDLCLCLDGIQDPGNLGTIIRTADWFGIRHIICSENTADAYSPKTVQATMGSIARVNLYYTNLSQLFHSLDKSIPVYGTLLDGEDIYNNHLSHNGIIVMGNEGNGISAEIRQQLTNRLLIPPYPNDASTAESLNVAIATAIICSEFRRRC